MSVLFATFSYAVFAAWALVSMSAIGMWAWLTIAHPVLSGSTRTHARLDGANALVGITRLD